MSILRPINTHGPFVPFERPLPIPSDRVDAGTQVSIKFSEAWIPAVYSALKALCRPETWEGTDGDIRQAVIDAHQLFTIAGEGMPVGTIVQHMYNTTPDNWLDCSGATHLREDYPQLYAVIDAAYIVDADHFIVPDLRGRIPVGSGAGSGLTSRAVNAIGGEENHVLTVPELPAHHHTYNHGNISLIAQNSNTRNTVNTETSINTGDTGSGTAHNNMPPYAAVKYAVVAR